MGRPTTDQMKEYRYSFKSMFYKNPIELQAVIFAQNYADADRYFYFKVLTEFQPREFTQIVLESTLDSCTECLIPTEEIPFANPGILMFEAKINGKCIRNLEKTRLAWKDENWHTLDKTITFYLSYKILIVLRVLGIILGAGLLYWILSILG